MPNGSTHAFLHRVLDSAVVLFTLLAVVLLYDVRGMGPYYWLAGLVGILGIVVLGEATHLYSSWRVYPFHQEAAELLLVFAAVGAAMVIFAFFTKTSADYSRVVIATWWTSSFFILLLLRYTMRRLLRASRARGHNLRTLAIAGAGDLGKRIAERVLAADWLGLKLTGFYDDNVTRGTRPLDGRPFGVRGDLAELVQLARKGGVDYVYVALPLRRPEKVMELIRQLSDSTASVFLVPDFFMFEITQARWTDIGGMPVVNIFDTPFLGVDGWLKRLEDLGLVLLILVPALPLMLLIAIAIKLTSPGPVLFRQRRYGLSGTVVEVLKFRSMTVLEDGDQVPQARRSDPRVTRFGAFLRRTSLDELPQLINVLRGEMSVVGPRPHAVAHNEQYRKLVAGYMLRHKVKPGMTGWAQVNGWRGQTDTVEKMQKRVDCDLYYIRNWTIWLDVKIVLLTVVRALAHSTAY
jgi:putative colanic acid biosynthesis UDP-glucose lipid carrier transferase